MTIKFKLRTPKRYVQKQRSVDKAVRLNDIDWLKNNCSASRLRPVDVTFKRNQPARRAVEYGNFDVLKWLVTESGQNVDLTDLENHATRTAVTHKRLDILKWLVNDSGQNVDVTMHGNWNLQAAAQNGSLDIVQWLLTDCKQVPNIAELNNNTLQAAARYAQLDVVKWMVEEDTLKIDVTAEESLALHAAASNHHLKTVNWLVNESWKYTQNLFTPEDIAESYAFLEEFVAQQCPDYLIVKDHFEVFQSLRALGYSADESLTEITKLAAVTNTKRIRRI